MMRGVLPQAILSCTAPYSHKCSRPPSMSAGGGKRSVPQLNIPGKQIAAYPTTPLRFYRQPQLSAKTGRHIVPSPSGRAKVRTGVIHSALVIAWRAARACPIDRLPGPPSLANDGSHAFDSRPARLHHPAPPNAAAVCCTFGSKCKKPTCVGAGHRRERRGFRSGDERAAGGGASLLSSERVSFASHFHGFGTLEERRQSGIGWPGVAGKGWESSLTGNGTIAGVATTITSSAVWPRFRTPVNSGAREPRRMHRCAGAGNGEEGGCHVATGAVWVGGWRTVLSWATAVVLACGTACAVRAQRTSRHKAARIAHDRSRKRSNGSTDWGFPCQRSGCLWPRGYRFAVESGDAPPENMYVLAFLLKSEGDSFTVIWLNLDTHTFKATLPRDAHASASATRNLLLISLNEAAAYVQSVRALKVESKDEASGTSATFGISGLTWPRKPRCSCSPSGVRGQRAGGASERVSLDFAGEFSRQEARDAKPRPLRETVSREIADKEMWSSVLAFGDVEVSRKDLLRRIERIVNQFPESEHVLRSARRRTCFGRWFARMMNTSRTQSRQRR